MIKNCKVIMRNSEIMIVDYDGTYVQMKSDKSTSEFVKVNYMDGKYSLFKSGFVSKPNSTDVKKVRKIKIENQK